MLRDRIFISYSHQDRKYLDELLPHLTALQDFAGLDPWSDKNIKAGDEWRLEIEAALARARVALMLVSSHFLASEFIRNNELRVLMAAAKTSGVRILWVPVEPSVVKNTPLAAFQSAWPIETPIEMLNGVERGKAWVTICEKILEVGQIRTNEPRTQEPMDREIQPQESDDSIAKARTMKRELQRSSGDAAEYEKAMDKIRKLLRTYAPQFAESLTFSSSSIASEVTAENVFRLETARAIIFGQSRVGKTTTINRLLEVDLFPTTGELTCTRSLAAAQHKGGLIFYDSPGIGDEPRQENITRAALGLDQLPDEQVDQIRLLDITSAQKEGPSDFAKLPFSEYASELGAGQQSALAKRVVAKEFALGAFRRWQASNPFVFAIYLVGSERGMAFGDSRLIGDLCSRHGADGLKLFKVFNVFHDRYKPTEAALAPETAKILDQAKLRLKKAGVPEYENWTLIDSRNGLGLDEFVRSFAEGLPVDVLKDLAKVVKIKYRHLIQERMSRHYKDYLALVAALVAVFPTDHTEGNIHFLDFLLSSLMDVAELLSADTIDSGTKNYASSIVAQVRARSLRRSYERTKDYKLGGVLTPISEFFNLYDWRSQMTGEKFGVGGINSIRLILPLGLALSTFLHSTKAKDFGVVLEDSKSEIDFQVSEIAEEIGAITRFAGRGGTIARVELAEDLYPLLRKILA